MSTNTKKIIIAVLGVLGLIVLLLGIFTALYNVWIGTIAAFLIWLFTLFLGKALGLKNRTESK